MTVATAALGGPAMGELLFAGRLGAERHRLDAVRQDAHAPRLDLERHALVLVGVLPFVAHGAALDQHPHTFLVQRLPVLGVAVPQLHGRPEAAAIFVLAVLLRDRVVEVDVQAKQPARRSEEHTSELQSLMRISYAVFCLKKKIKESADGIE